MNRRKRRHRERVRKRMEAERRRRRQQDEYSDDDDDDEEDDPSFSPGPIAAIAKEKAPRGLTRRHFQLWKKDKAKRLAVAMRGERERHLDEDSHPIPAGASAAAASVPIPQPVPAAAVRSSAVVKWPFFEGSGSSSGGGGSDSSDGEERDSRRSSSVTEEVDEEEPSSFGEVDDAFDGFDLLSREPPPPPAELASSGDAVPTRHRSPSSSLHSQLKILLDQAPPADLSRSRLRKWKKRHRRRISREKSRIARLKQVKEQREQQQKQLYDEQFDEEQLGETKSDAVHENGFPKTTSVDEDLEDDVVSSDSSSRVSQVSTVDAMDSHLLLKRERDTAQRRLQRLQRSFGDLENKLRSAEIRLRRSQDGSRKLEEKNAQSENQLRSTKRQLEHATTRSRQLVLEVDVLRRQLEEERQASRVVDIEMVAVQLVSSLPSDSCESASLAQKKIDQIDLLLCQTQTALSRLMEEASSRKKSLIGVRNHLSGSSISRGESEFCVVCWERPRSILLLPCRHLCLCSKDECGRLDDCPLCRVPIESRMKIFVS